MLTPSQKGEDMSVELKLIEMKAVIETAERDAATAEGALKQLEQQAKEHGVDDLDDLDDVIDEIEKGIEKLDKKISAGVKKLEEDFDL